MKRYAFSLMELMIALSLTTLVMGFLFASLYQSTTLDKKFEKGKALVLQRATFQERIDQIFAHVVDEKGVYLDEGTLFIPFDHGIDQDPDLSGLITATLKVKNHSLLLTLHGKNKKTRKEILTPAQKMECEFLYLDSQKVVTTQEWEKRTKSNPLYVKLTIDGEPYIFWVNHYDTEIPLKP